MENPIREHMELSHYAAQHPRLVQGGGGNCSVKFSAHMVVKASGYFLEDVGLERGFAVVGLQDGRPLPESKEKVSLEAGLHRLLNTYVIHTHPIAAAALVGSEEGKRFFRQIFPEATYVWVDYAAPGKRLFQKVEETLRPFSGKMPERQALLLQNHGLFTAAASKQACMQFHEETVRKLEDFFQPEARADLPAMPPRCYLTPDHAVYSSMDIRNLSPKQETSVREIEIFGRSAFELILKKGWHPAWLPAGEVDFVLGMEEEKYRQQMWKETP